MAGVAILLLVKEPGAVPPTGALIHYRDIGDYLSRDDKLSLLAEALPATSDGPASLDSLGWVTLKANEQGDWINQRSESFRSHMPAHAEAGASVFGLRTLGLGTNRDAWNFNSSKAALDTHIEKMLSAFNAEADRVEADLAKGGTLRQRTELVKQHVIRDSSRFSWNESDFAAIARGDRYSDDDRVTRTAMYRPFHLRWAETGRRFNNRLYQLPRVFPTASSEIW
jgi:predicted helicase